jgi:hypothetical protein
LSEGVVQAVITFAVKSTVSQSYFSLKYSKDQYSMSQFCFLIIFQRLVSISSCRISVAFCFKITEKFTTKFASSVFIQEELHLIVNFLLPTRFEVEYPN